MKPEKDVNCFAYGRYGECLALRGVRTPKECEKCRFKKPKRNVTNGKVFPDASEVKGYTPKYITRDSFTF